MKKKNPGASIGGSRKHRAGAPLARVVLRFWLNYCDRAGRLLGALIHRRSHSIASAPLAADAAAREVIRGIPEVPCQSSLESRGAAVPRAISPSRAVAEGAEIPLSDVRHNTPQPETVEPD